ncbi:MAG TPA: flagellar protein FliT [Accumulibacter sp.]|jgi:enoyl-CoA hydratase/carnithine racemase|nr:flagellar protein FliT [Accumulibacter sp.]
MTTLPLLERLLASSEAMLRAADAEDWEAVEKCDQERRALTAQWPDELANGLPPASIERAKALIDDCLRRDAEVGTRVRARLNELRVLLREPQV